MLCQSLQAWYSSGALAVGSGARPPGFQSHLCQQCRATVPTSLSRPIFPSLQQGIPSSGVKVRWVRLLRSSKQGLMECSNHHYSPELLLFSTQAPVWAGEQAKRLATQVGKHLFRDPVAAAYKCEIDGRLNRVFSGCRSSARSRQ